MTPFSREATLQAALSMPSAGAIVLAWLQAPLTVWQVRLGVAILVLQLAYLVRKWWREERPRRRGRRRKADAASDGAGEP